MKPVPEERPLQADRVNNNNNNNNKHEHTDKKLIKYPCWPLFYIQSDTIMCQNVSLSLILVGKKTKNG